MNPPQQRSILLTLLLFATTQINAQTDVWNSAAKKNAKTTSTITRWKTHLQQWGLDTSYKHALSIGGRLNTSGWGGLITYHSRIRPGQYHFFQLSFSEVKHEKQLKQKRENTAFPELGTATPFIFGKINNLYLLQFGHGREQLLLPGVLEGNISLSLRLQAGISLAMLKPYYLRMIQVDYTPDQVATLREEKYTPENADLFLKRENILGASKWNKGLDQISYNPGAYAEAAFAIQPAKNKTLIQTILLGANISIYGKKLPVMAERTAYPWQACLFAGLTLGKRW